MFYTYKNCQIEIDGKQQLVRNINLSIKANISPVYLTKTKFAKTYAPTKAVGGVANIEYFLTGHDPIKAKIYSEEDAISGNFGGLVFNSGYITKYSMEAAPNTTTKAKATIEFFEHLTGNFVPTTGIPPKDEEILNCSNASVNGTGLGEYGYVTNVSFGYENQVTANYGVATGSGITHIKPDRIVFGPKTMTSSVRLSDMSGVMSIYGGKGNLSMLLTQEGDSTVREEFLIHGYVTNKQIGGTSTSTTENILSIVQGRPSEIAVITGITSYSGYAGNTITLSGYNFNTFPVVTYGGVELENVTYVSDTVITFTVPVSNVPSGYIATVNGEDTNEQSSTQGSNNATVAIPSESGGAGKAFVLPVDSASISRLIGKHNPPHNPTTGFLGDMILIRGANFGTVSNVYFTKGSWVSADNFTILHTGFIQARVPRETQHGPVSVYSHFTHPPSSGVSSEHFTPNPVILGVSNLFPDAYEEITVSGWALSGITGAFFGSGRLTGTVNSGEVTDILKLPVVVPSGNIGTYVELVGISGLSDIFSGFEATAKLTGVQPTSGVLGSFVTFFGQNMVTGILQRSSNDYSSSLYNKWNVDFGGTVTGFSLIPESGAITGLVPYDAGGGSKLVRMKSADGGTHKSGVYFNIVGTPPVITEVFSS